MQAEASVAELTLVELVTLFISGKLFQYVI